MRGWFFNRTDKPRRDERTVVRQPQHCQNCLCEVERWPHQFLLLCRSCVNEVLGSPLKGRRRRVA